MTRQRYFDANTWIGHYPFTPQPAHTPSSLLAHLKTHGIEHALTSPIDALFAPDPTFANEHLLFYTRATPELIPVPIINPALANWREQLDSATNDPRVCAIRLAPAYHDYADKPRCLRALMAETQARNLRVILTARLVDQRHEYHSLNIKPLSTSTLGAILKQWATDSHPLLISGLLYSEINTLAPAHPHMLADLSFAEWHNTLESLLHKTQASQLVFASHTPFLITAAATAKFERIRAARHAIDSVTHKNLEKFITL